MEEIFKIVSENQFRVFWYIWAKQWHIIRGEFYATWYGYSQLQDETKIPISKLKKLMKKLLAEGICKLQPTYNSELMLSGSGYFIQNGMEEYSFDEVCRYLFHKREFSISCNNQTGTVKGARE